MDKEAIRGKRRARKMTLQALYQWQMSGSELTEIEAQYRAQSTIERVDVEYFVRLLHGVSQHLSEVESAFTPFLDRAISDLNPIELAALRLSTFELMFCLEIPYKVVLDESVALTKEFGSQDGYRYVNGVLHQIAKQTRALEIKHQDE